MKLVNRLRLENLLMHLLPKVALASTEMKEWPTFIQDRIALWDKLMQKHKEELANKVARNTIKFVIKFF